MLVVSGNRGGTPGPQKSSDDARAALIRDPLMVADTQTTSLSRCGTFKSRTTGTPRATQTYEVPVLTDEELGKQLQVVLTETDTMLLLEIPGELAQINCNKCCLKCCFDACYRI